MTRSIRFSISPDTLPTRWTFPHIGWNDGCQVLKCYRGLQILREGTDRLDDWYSQGKYGHVFLIEHDGHSGHTRLGYPSITEDDVVEMRHLDRETCESISRETDDDDVVMQRLWDEGDPVTVEWVDPTETETPDMSWDW